MSGRDIVNDKKVTALLAPAARTADASGAVDRKGYRDLALLFAFGAEGITLSATDKIEAVVEHSDDNSTFTKCVAADLVLPENMPSGWQAPGANDGIVFVANENADIPAVFLVGYRGSKRYVRGSADYSGTHGAATPEAVIAIQEGAQVSPAGQAA